MIPALILASVVPLESLGIFGALILSALTAVTIMSTVSAMLMIVAVIDRRLVARHVAQRRALEEVSSLARRYPPKVASSHAPTIYQPSPKGLELDKIRGELARIREAIPKRPRPRVVEY